MSEQTAALVQRQLTPVAQRRQPGEDGRLAPQVESDQQRHPAEARDQEARAGTIAHRGLRGRRRCLGLAQRTPSSSLRWHSMQLRAWGIILSRSLRIGCVQSSQLP